MDCVPVSNAYSQSLFTTTGRLYFGFAFDRHISDPKRPSLVIVKK